MFIPGWVIALLTFPGVIVHESAHMLFCKWRGVPVLDVCFFRIGNPSGYVIHGTTENFISIFLIAVGPFIINTALCLFICLPASVPWREFNHLDPLLVVILWLGVSIGMHAFPSNQDAGNLWEASHEAVKNRHPLAIVSYPLIILIYIANFLRIIWFDSIYGIAIGVWLPEFILNKVLA